MLASLHPKSFWLVVPVIARKSLVLADRWFSRRHRPIPVLGLIVLALIIISYGRRSLGLEPNPFRFLLWQIQAMRAGCRSARKPWPPAPPPPWLERCAT